MRKMLLLAAAVLSATIRPEARELQCDTVVHPVTADEIAREKLQESHKVVFVGDGPEAPHDSVMRMINMYYIDQFHHFKDPLAPYFLLMSKDANLSMGIGGAVRMRGWIDFDGAVPINSFDPYMIPVPRNPELRRRLGGTPAGTSLFFRVIGFNTVVKNFNAYIQCDFSGPDNVGFKLKKAYVTMQDWTIGYATTSFSDPAAEVPSIDAAGANGRTKRSAMLVRWMHTFTSHWSMAASVEMPDHHVNAGGVECKSLNDWMPDYVVFGQYEWEHEQHVRLTGVLRVLPYRDLLAGVNRNVIGWGAQASAVCRPLGNLTLYGEFSFGRGYSSYVEDFYIGNYDLVESPSRRGRMFAPRTMGMLCGFKYNFRYNVYACAVYSQARYFNSYSASIPDDYKLGHFAGVNIFWDMTPRLQVGMEYVYGQRRNFSGAHNHANRINALFQFAF